MEKTQQKVGLSVKHRACHAELPLSLLPSSNTIDQSLCSQMHSSIFTSWPVSVWGINHIYICSAI